MKPKHAEHRQRADAVQYVDMLLVETLMLFLPARRRISRRRQHGSLFFHGDMIPQTHSSWERQSGEFSFRPVPALAEADDKTALFLQGGFVRRKNHEKDRL